MSELLRWSSFLIVMTTLLFSGWLHGLWTGRWQPKHELMEALARVNEVPMSVGEWSAEEQKTDEEDFRKAGAQSYWARRYTHARTKDSVLVILMCGRAGRMSAHTPEICYQGAGFNMTHAPETWTVRWLETASECSATFWTAQLRKTGTDLAPLRLIWSWNSRGSWQALRAPRWDTVGEPFLYKMYISLEEPAESRRTGSSSSTRPAADKRVAEGFLLEFLPKLQETLFPELLSSLPALPR